MDGFCSPIDYLKSLDYEDSMGPLALHEGVPKQWFALRVKSNFERTTALHLRERGFQEFFPTYVQKNHWSDRVKTIEKPLFPGYVFCHFSAQVRLPILTIPGVLHIVGIGKAPQPVDELEMAALWKTLRSGLLLQPWPFLTVGQRVVVERGPLTGVEGMVIRFKGTYRLVLSISVLQRSIAAEIERGWIRPTRTVVGEEKRSNELGRSELTSGSGIQRVVKLLEKRG
jgi:transcription antitermination factor NusG